MGKSCRSLLVALVFMGALVSSAWVVKSHASTARSTVTPQSSRYTGPSTEGEPDSGSTGKDTPKQNTGGGISGRNDGGRGPIRWLRWTSGILMARSLGVVRF